MCLTAKKLLHQWTSPLAVGLLIGVPISSWGQQAQVTPNRISLSDAIKRAQENEPIFAASVAAQKTASIDSYLAKAALLPSVTYHNQVLYTQPNGQKNSGGQVGSQAA